MDHYANFRRNSRQHKLFEFSDLDWRIGQRIITPCHAASLSRASHIFGVHRGTPFGREVPQTHARVFASAIARIHQNHRRINKRVFAIQLRRVWSRFIPVRAVADGNCSVPADAPRLLVQFFNGHRSGSNRRLDALHVAAKIADLV